MKNFLLVLLLMVAACGKDSQKTQQALIDSSHQAVDVEQVNPNLSALVNKKIKVTGYYNVASNDSCIMDLNSSACVDVDPIFFSNYAALGGQALTLYGVLKIHNSTALLEVYYFKDYSWTIKKVPGRDY